MGHPGPAPGTLHSGMVAHIVGRTLKPQSQQFFKLPHVTVCAELGLLRVISFGPKYLIPHFLKKNWCHKKVV